jgi:hypothetical protein
MSDKKYICTYFDKNYLPRGLALFNSIKQFHESFNLFILTLDEFTYDYLRQINEERIKLISVNTFNQYFNTPVNKFPDKKQYYFSSTPNLCLYVLKKNPEIDILLYLDADVFLFNSLDLLYKEFGDSSIGVCRHRENPILKLFVNHYGKYNVGVNFFRNSTTAINCLNDWKYECETWYQGKPGYPLSFFSDQIFLDTWDLKFKDLKVIENIGVNTCYWNAVNYKFRKINGIYYVNKTPLIIFHFSSLVKENDNLWNTNSVYGFVSIKGTLLEIYREYILKIESYGLNNNLREKIAKKESLKKSIYKNIAKMFVNQKVIMNW